MTYTEGMTTDPRPISPADLGGVAELAGDLGVSKQQISNYAAGRSRPDTGFPDPVVRLAATPIWSRSEVRLWAAGLTSKAEE